MLWREKLEIKRERESGRKRDLRRERGGRIEAKVAEKRLVGA